MFEAALRNYAPRVGRKQNLEKNRFQWTQNIPKTDPKWIKRKPKRKGGTNGYEIYEISGVMHAAVFGDGAPEAKIAQVVGRMQNFKGLQMRKIAIGTAKRAT